MSEFVQNSMAKAFGISYPTDEEIFYDEGIVFDEMGKAIDRAKCHIEWITDKNGHKKRVWVRNDPKEKGKKHHASNEEGSEEKEGKEEEASTPKEYKAGDINKNDTVTFTDANENTVTGIVKATGQDGVTVETLNGTSYQVRYEKISKGGFDAQNYKLQSTDKLATNDENGAQHIYDLLDKENPGLGDKVAKMAQKKLKELDRRIKKNGDTEKRFSTSEGVYSVQRQKLHEHIIRSFFYGKNEKCKPENPPPKFIMLGGRGGSGKSWFTNKGWAESEGRQVMFDPDKFLVIDADAIKEMLPEFEGWNAGEVHEESSYLAKKIRALAFKKGLNVIIDGTMNYKASKPNKVRDEILEAKNLGYSTEAHYMYLPIQESSQRVVTRYAGDIDEETGEPKFDGRLVPMDISLGMQDNEKSFDSIKDLVDDWSFRDNNGPITEGPKLIAQKKK